MKANDERPSDKPVVSVVMLVDTSRENAQVVLDALDGQTCGCGVMEIVVLDMGEAGAEALRMPERYRVKLLRRPGKEYWRVARARAARVAEGEIVAFLEDHCSPEPEWAEELVAAAGDGRWVALGSVFANGSEDSWWTRAALAADYGHYLAPYAGREEGWLAGSCIAYERGYLERNRERILEVAGVDFTIQEMVRGEGLRMRVVAGARVGHLAFAGIGEMMAAGYEHARLLVWGRMRMGERGWRWRVVRLAGLGLVVPFQWVRLGRAMGRRGLGRLVSAFPVVVAGTLATVLGEAAGLLRGVGDAPRRFVEIELGSRRLR